MLNFPNLFWNGLLVKFSFNGFNWCCKPVVVFGCTVWAAPDWWPQNLIGGDEYPHANIHAHDCAEKQHWWDKSETNVLANPFVVISIQVSFSWVGSLICGWIWPPDSCFILCRSIIHPKTGHHILNQRMDNICGHILCSCGVNWFYRIHLFF